MAMESFDRFVTAKLAETPSLLLDEVGIQAHVADFKLSRQSGNELAVHVVELGLGLVCSVELFLNEATGDMVMIRLLISRDMDAHTLRLGQLADELFAANCPDAVITEHQTNLNPH